MGKYCDEKRGRRRDERGRKERAEEERNCTARVSYRVITILGHFHPFPLSPSPASSLSPTPSHRPRRLLTLNFLSCITALRLSSGVKKNKWKKQAERERPYLRKRGASSNLSISLVVRLPTVVLRPRCIFFYNERESMTGARSIPRHFTAAKRRIPTEIYIRNGAQ